MWKTHKLAVVLVCVAVSVSACGLTEKCEWIERLPKFPFPGPNVAVVGNCTQVNADIERILIEWDTPYMVIDRSSLEAIFAEHGLAVHGVTEPQSLAKMGKIAGVDALVITRCSGDDVNIRFVDTKSGRVLAVQNASGQWGSYNISTGFVPTIMPWQEQRCR